MRKGTIAMRSIFLSFLLAFVASAPSRAAEQPAADPVLAEATDLAGTAMFMTSGTPGMILVVVRSDRSLVLGYGETEKGNKQTPDGNSLLRLNSVTKVFTTEVLVALAAEGKLSLTDPLQRTARGAKVPALGTRQITLLDLATNSAALPREMEDAPEGVFSRAWPTRADRWKWFLGYKLPWAPGSIAAYSNVGYDLLADAIETAAGRSYPELIRRLVTAPLGMADTGFAPTHEQCARLMVGTGAAPALASTPRRRTAAAGFTAPATTWRAGCATTSRTRTARWR